MQTEAFPQRNAIICGVLLMLKITMFRHCWMLDSWLLRGMYGLMILSMVYSAYFPIRKYTSDSFAIWPSIPVGPTTCKNWDIPRLVIGSLDLDDSKILLFVSSLDLKSTLSSEGPQLSTRRNVWISSTSSMIVIINRSRLELSQRKSSQSLRILLKNWIKKLCRGRALWTALSTLLISRACYSLVIGSC